MSFQKKTINSRSYILIGLAALSSSLLVSVTSSYAEVRKTKHIADVAVGVLEHYKKFGPTRMGVLFDVDGTLTTVRSPERTKKSRALPRGAAVELVKSIYDLHVPIYASSAWRRFFETVDRITDLGLDKYFGLSSDSRMTEPKSLTLNYDSQEEGIEKSLVYYQSGSVISVFEGAQLFPGYAYMTGKAFAPYVEQLRVQQGRPLGEVLSDQPFQGFIVVEDSAGGIGHYQELVQRYNLFPGAEIIYYELADPAEDI